MATLTATGIGSGLDLNSLLEQIVNAERVPTENRLNLQEAELLEEISAYGSVKSVLSGFQSSISTLGLNSTFNSHSVSIQNDDLFSASASSIADEGSYNVEVRQLAAKHSLATVAFDEVTDIIGTGTLTFEFGTTDYDSGTDTYNSFTANPDISSESIIIDSSNNTVEGIRDAINEADIGISASIIYDGTGYRLLMSSEATGKENSLRISVDEGSLPADNIDPTGLSQLAFNGSATNLQQTQEALDAELTINGLLITRDTNSISGAINGVTLSLKSANIGNPTTLDITKSDTAASNAIKSFVDAYNELVSTLNSLTQYDVDTEQASALTGDTTTISMLSQIRREMGNLISGLSGPYTSLYQIGINTQRDGTLTIDDSVLSSALSSNLQSVAQLFTASGTPTDTDVTYLNASANTQPGQYSVFISSLATQGQLSGDAILEPITVDGSNETISISVNNVPVSITLNQGSYTGTELAQELQNRINTNSTLQLAGASVSVSFDIDHLEINSNIYGSNSKVTVSSDYADFGLNTSSTISTGTDVVGSIGGLPAKGEGQNLTGTGDAAGLKLLITGTDIGESGRVNYSLGYAANLTNLLTNMLSSTGIVANKTSSLQSQVDSIGEERLKLDKRVSVIEERYRRQFVNLDVLLGGLQATSNYLSQQLESIPEINISQK